jgi:tetratricopeptide (TPR) repeat protein
MQWFRKFNTRAEAEFKEFLRTKASEREINDHAYSLYRRGRIEDAVNVLRINVERFPDSSNVHDNYGEALALSGDIAGAITSYERALELTTEKAEKERIHNVLKTLGNRL